MTYKNIIKEIEKVFLLSPILVFMTTAFTVPDAKSLISRLVPIVVIYCLLKYRGEIKKNVANKNLRLFFIVSAVFVIYGATLSFFRGEEFGPYRTILTSVIYLAAIPWQKFQSRHLFLACVLGGISSGTYALYATQVLEQQRAGEVVNPIPFALFCLICSIFLINTIITKKQKWSYQALYIIGLIFSLIAIVLSGVRGIWIATPLTFIIFFIFQESLSKKFRVNMVVLFCVFTFCFFYIFQESINKRISISVYEYNEIMNGNLNTSIGYRLGMWSIGLKWIKESPIIGIGTNSIIPRAQNADISDGVRYFLRAHFHNQFIDTTVRNGILGLFVFLFWFISLPYLLIKLLQTNQKTFVFSALTAILIASLTDVPFHHTHIMYAYTLLFGALLCITVRER
ncbi:O-antigen ligase family protein [Veronia pacifica]|uniref:O-antigen ligase-related domain-containing protein n=1 Tax=Veronia pacifica TaxID=1080227 RepID=A0A1C3ER70_9GAMM|nr:O-antigen ligase family protein [Veronia pacifica]ODA35754.1 hypothetical protein A8L45_01560 [Veronia pacifica]